MLDKRKSKLNPRKRYLQIALNSTLNEAFKIISQLPRSERILIEAGTPLIKRYGEDGIRQIKSWYQQHLLGITQPATVMSKPAVKLSLGGLIKAGIEEARKQQIRAKKTSQSSNQETLAGEMEPYIVADLKMMDRGETEVRIASRAGADAAVALGHAPTESLDAFIAACDQYGVDAMIDMMNVPYPLEVLTKLKKMPTVVMLHRGVDEEHYNKEKMLPLYEIKRIKGRFDHIMIAIAGGDTIREVQSALFNDADIVVVWKSFYQSTGETAKLAKEFLSHIK